MSNGQSSSYKFEYAGIAKAQIREIAASLKEAVKLREFIARVKKAANQSDPHGWGDPQYRSKFVDAVYFQGLLRPVMFRYVIFDQVRAVVLLSVQLYAEFD